MARPRAADGDDRDPRHRILDAAARTFAARGHAGARIDRIAALAGVNKAMVYYYVGGKDALYAAAFAARVDEALGALRAALAETNSPPERLRAIVASIAGTASRNPTFAPMILREIASGGADLPDEVLTKIASVLAVVAGVLEEGRRAGAFRRVDPALMQMIIGGSLFVLISGTPVRVRIRRLGLPKLPPGDDSVESITGTVTELLLHGLTPRRARAVRSRNPRAARRRGIEP
jgi:TetR/AcrR family transcriptional regulator